MAAHAVRADLQPRWLGADAVHEKCRGFDAPHHPALAHALNVSGAVTVRSVAPNPPQGRHSVAFFAAENVLAANQYLAEFIRNGPTRDWTNAIYPLSADLMQSHYGEVAGSDWGTVVPLGVLERETAPLSWVDVDDNEVQPALAK